MKNTYMQTKIDFLYQVQKHPYKRGSRYHLLEIKTITTSSTKVYYGSGSNELDVWIPLFDFTKDPFT